MADLKGKYLLSGGSKFFPIKAAPLIKEENKSLRKSPFIANIFLTHICNMWRALC